MKNTNTTLAVVVLLSVTALAGAGVPGPIKVSPDGRHFVDKAGKPFFWLGDTAWPLFTQYSREQAEAYLENRGAKGFTVIQGVLVWGHGSGMEEKSPVANPQGHKPWLDDDRQGPTPPTSSTSTTSWTTPTARASSSRCSRPGATT